MAVLIEELCNLNGVSGDEGRVRAFLREKIEPYADEIIVDSMGNMMALKKGRSHDKKVMLSAHMDEVGFIVSGFTEKGYLEFKTVGGIDTRVIISKKVAVGEKKIPGVIGMKAIHLQKRSERESVPEIKSLYIDIGAKSKAEAKEKAALGDYVSFATEFSEFGDGKIKAKAIDDRAGCAVLAEQIKKVPVYDTWFCFLVQEEVGLRGARIAANRIEPDAALVLEATTCSDVYGCREHEYVTSLGGGVVLTARDGASIVDDSYRKQFEKLALDEGIPYQYKKTTRGGNDAGAIYISGKGVKCASLSIPCRYLHSPVGVAALGDIEAMQRLVEKYLECTDKFI